MKSPSKLKLVALVSYSEKHDRLKRIKLPRYLFEKVVKKKPFILRKYAQKFQRWLKHREKHCG